MTALRRFIPTADYRSYRVTVSYNKWDKDWGKATIRIPDAIGRIDAGNLALASLGPEYPDAGILRVIEDCRRCEHEAHKGACSEGFRNEREWQPCGCTEAA